MNKIIFCGTPSLAASLLECLITMPEIAIVGIITQPDKPLGRGKSLQPTPVKEVAIRNNIPVVQPVKLRKEMENLSAWIKGTEAEGCVVAAYGQILPPEFLSLFKKGCINVHASLLPRWRGAAPIQRSVEAGDKITGVCLMAMNEGLDTGDVFISKEISLDPHETGGSLFKKIAQVGTELLNESLVTILNKEIEKVPQPSEGITYAHKIEESESLIDWNNQAIILERKVRAFDPFPGTYTYLGNERIKIFGIKILDSEVSEDAQAYYQGEAFLSSQRQRGVIVKTNDFFVEITSAQRPGEKRVSGGEFAQWVKQRYADKKLQFTMGNNI